MKIWEFWDEILVRREDMEILVFWMSGCICNELK